MYCQTCGTAVTTGLSYCNRCGAELNSKPAFQKPSDTMPESLIWAIVGVAVTGMGIVIALMALMKQMLGIDDTEIILLLSFLSFIPFGIAEIVLVWMLFRTQRNQKDRELTEHKASVTSELGGVDGQLLREPAASVTDHTTRTLEPVNRAKSIR